MSNEKPGWAPAILVYRKVEHPVKPGMTLRDAIKKIDIDPYAVLGMRDGKLVTDDVILKPGDTIKLVAVVSGG
jgi:sulfur carrier protein ThiS